MISNRLNKDLLKKVAREWFVGNPVKLSTGLEGQAISDISNHYLLGCVAGPEVHVSHLFHEMAHLAEREPEKLKEKPFGSWGFSLGKYWGILGKCGWEPQTDQQVQREARVWAYQLNLHRYYGLNAKPYNMISSAKYLPAFCHFERKHVKNIGDYKKEEKIALSLLANQVDEMSRKDFTFEDFRVNWCKRMELLK